MRTVIVSIFALLAIINGVSVVDTIATGYRPDMLVLTIGCALLCLHAALNPDHVRNPFAQNAFDTGRFVAAGKLGLLLLVVGSLQAADLSLPMLPHEAAKFS